jgi:hypothetical protein
MATQKHLSNDNEIRVIVVEECSPHLFLSCAEFRSCHENAFQLERSVDSWHQASFDYFRALDSNHRPRKPHES